MAGWGGVGRIGCVMVGPSSLVELVEGVLVSAGRVRVLVEGCGVGGCGLLSEAVAGFLGEVEGLVSVLGSGFGGVDSQLERVSVHAEFVYDTVPMILFECGEGSGRLGDLKLLCLHHLGEVEAGCEVLLGEVRRCVWV